MAYYHRHLPPSSKMISILPLLVVAALVSQQNGFEANAQIVESKLTSTNILQPNVKEPVKRVNKLKNNVHISMAPVEEVRRMAGEWYELECVAAGNPLPSINWMKNGKTIQDVEKVNEIVPTASNALGILISKLIITDSTPGEDKYTCVAEGGLIPDTATSTVYTVTNNDENEDLLNLHGNFLPSKPTITYIYSSLIQDIGSLAILPCRVHSLTTSQSEWQDTNGWPIYGTSGMRVLPSGDLLISSLRMADKGNFTCVAVNMHGKDSATTFVFPAKP